MIAVSAGARPAIVPRGDRVVFLSGRRERQGRLVVLRRRLDRVRLRMSETVVVAARDELVAATCWPTACRWPRCSPRLMPASSVATVVWPPSARSCGRWPPHPHPPIPGGHHESSSVGGDPPFARSGAVVAGGDRPTTALFPSHGPQGVGDGVAARVEAGAAAKAFSTVTGRRSTRFWPSIPTSTRCG